MLVPGERILNTAHRMKLALVADWLPTFGGAEHVIAEFHALWPQAPLFTTVARRERIGPLQGSDIRVSSLQKWFTLLKRHEVLLPWMPRAIEAIDLRAYDVIVSSSHAVAKGIIPPSGALHVCYCHTPCATHGKWKRNTCAISESQGYCIVPSSAYSRASAAGT